MSEGRLSVYVCTGPVCGDPGLALARGCRKLVERRGWQERVEVHREVCLGYCHQGPNVMLCAQGDAWGRAPLPGAPGSESLHEMTEAALESRLEARLEKAAAGQPEDAPRQD